MYLVIIINGEKKYISINKKTITRSEIYILLEDYIDYEEWHVEKEGEKMSKQEVYHCSNIIDSSRIKTSASDDGYEPF